MASRPKSKAKAEVLRRARRHKARESGLCFTCSKRASLPNRTKCDICTLREHSRRAFGTTTKWRALQALLISQRWRCYYSGQKLQLGVNSSIEHIMPTSRNPSRATDDSNIRWVATEINTMKNNMTVHEFLMACKKILKNFGYKVDKE